MSHAPASYIVQAPAPTLESISAELLPLARAAGFASLSFSQTLSTAYGSRYHAHAMMSAAQGFAATPLAGVEQCTTVESLREVAQDRLYAIAGQHASL